MFEARESARAQPVTILPDEVKENSFFYPSQSTEVQERMLLVSGNDASMCCVYVCFVRESPISPRYNTAPGKKCRSDGIHEADTCACVCVCWSDTGCEERVAGPHLRVGDQRRHACLG